MPKSLTGKLIPLIIIMAERSERRRSHASGNLRYLLTVSLFLSLSTSHSLIFPFSISYSLFLSLSLSLSPSLVFPFSTSFSLSLSHTRYIKLKVDHYLLFMFSPQKYARLFEVLLKYVWLHFLIVFYMTQPSNKQKFCFGS